MQALNLNPVILQTVTMAGVAAALGHLLGRRAAACRNSDSLQVPNCRDLQECNMVSVATALGHPLGRHALACKPCILQASINKPWLAWLPRRATCSAGAQPPAKP